MKKTIAFCCLVAAALPSCQKSPTVATIGKDRVTAALVQERIQAMPPGYRNLLSTTAGKKQFLDLIVRERVVLEAARRSGHQKSKEYLKEVAEFKKEQLKRMKDYEEELLMKNYMQELHDQKIGPRDTEVDAYYEEHKQDFLHPVAITARHILLQTKDEAEKALARVKAGEDFSKLAQEISKDSISAVRGGEIGPFRKGDLVPEFERAVFPLKMNQVSDIIQTQFGYHVIKKVAEKALPAMTADEAKLEIRKIMEKTKFDAWFADAKKQYQVNVNYDALSRVQIEPGDVAPAITMPTAPTPVKKPINVKKQ